jgi:hypothetical protein
MKRLLLFAALLAWSGMAAAVVYKWVDAEGKVQYGDRPPDGVHAEVVELLISHSASARSAPAAAAAQAAPAARTAAAPTIKDIIDKNAVAQDVAQAREKQCTEAQERYKKLIEGRKIYKPGPNGERQFLTSEEIDAERLSAKQDINTACNGTT